MPGLLLLFLGCASKADSDVGDDLSKADYASSFVQATCDFYERCELLREYRYQSVEECVTKNTPSIEEQIADDATCGLYDGAAASECVAGIQALACEDLYTDWPAACGDICSYGR